MALVVVVPKRKGGYRPLIDPVFHRVRKMKSAVGLAAQKNIGVVPK